MSFSISSHLPRCGAWLSTAALGLALLPASLQAQTKAIPADQMLETIGIGTRFDWKHRDGQGAGAKLALENIGFRYVRVGIAGETNDPGAYRREWRDYARQKGLKLLLTCGGDTRQALTDQLAEWMEAPGVVWGVEGANETYDLNFGEFPNSFELQKFIYGLAQPKGLKVLTWTAAGAAATYLTWPNPDAYSTHANFHAYSWDTSSDNGKQIIPIWQDFSLKRDGHGDVGGLWAMDKWTGNASKPKAVTEWGFFYEPQGDTPIDSELSRAKYTLRNSFELLNAKVDKTFIYSLVDENDKFGIANGDGSLKQSGRALASLFALLRDPGHANDNTGSLNYTLTTASGIGTVDDRRHQTNEIHQTLLQKSNGHYILALWADKPSHIGQTGSEAATLKLNGLTASEVKIYLPLTNGTTAVQTLGAGTSTINLSGSIAIPDHPILIDITPSGTTSTPTPSGQLLANGVYTLTTKLVPSNGGASQRLDVAGGTDQNGQQVGVWDQNNLAPQNWYFEHAGGNVYTITAQVGAKNKQLDADNTGGIRKGSKVQLYGSGQRWLVESAGNGFFYLTPEAVMTQSPKLRLDVVDGKSTRGTYTNVQIWTPNDSDAQKWKIEPAGPANGIYNLTARHSGKRLDVASSSTADGAAVRQWRPNSSDAQRWQLTHVRDGYYTLTAQCSGKNLALDTNPQTNGGYSDLTTNGVQVFQFGNSTSDNRLWKVEATSDGYFKLTNKTSGKVLDVYGGPSATGDGAPVKSWAYLGGSNQQWKLDLSATATAAKTSTASLTAASPLAAASLTPTLDAYPNPSLDGKATLRLQATAAQRATVQVFNQQGQFVSLLTVPLQAGQTEFRLPASLSKGTYYLKTRIDGQAQSFTLKVE
ncbi:RICIN domain-containing protein [Hymenobacter weizhouensis]|uniref:RICIN domain-containing protein n=1 Tax=Hymenobacter sp. YIM 151500-1 TaxID=2987689 RepID=UPI002226B8E2|nr:RICIN domain-containing protein [Hymenobacter sp. YIM 151500-1]UYZ63623.1 RICIN domain-containing protein [Hymenobacter sp. YIM 151500-1]